MIRIALLLALLFPLPAVAQDMATIAVEVVEDAPGEPGADRFVATVPDSVAALPAIASYGPFRVIDGTRAALVDATDSASPKQFAQMLLAHPGIRTLEMVECPGTSDDVANLRLGRMIRRAGIATHVPENGSVRSGAVELFLAGARRTAEPGAEFAVHAWLDADGKEPGDFAASDPVNQGYLAYYREMGMSAEQAQRFYAMTNSVPHDDARWLSEAEFAQYASLN
jgi:hypothetical protein